MIKRKRVRFDFYDAHLALNPVYDTKAQKAAEKVRKNEGREDPYGRGQLEKYQNELEKFKHQQSSATTGHWDISALVRYACQDGVQVRLPTSGGDLLEIDRTTFYHDEPDIITFQVAILRSHDIPAKKQLGQAREDLNLNDDEYIGEFTQVIFDTRFHTVAIQSTKYGPSYAAVVSLLNEIDRKMHPDRVEIGCFDPIIDPKIITRINHAGKYKRMTLKCSEASYGEKNMVNHFIDARKYLTSSVEGFTMELSISFNGHSPDQTLDPQQVRQIISSFQHFQNDPSVSEQAKNDYGVNITSFDEEDNTYFDEEDNKYVIVDLLVPKLHFFVEVEMEARKVIESHYMYHLVTAEYRKCEGTLSRIMYNRLEGG